MIRPLRDGKVGSELADHAAGVVEDLAQCCASQRAFTERYVEGQIAVHLHLGLRSERRDLDPYYVCAVLHAPRRGDPALADDPGVAVGDEPKVELTVGPDEAEGWVHDLVFVLVGEPVEQGERVRVGLEPRYGCARSISATCFVAIPASIRGCWPAKSAEVDATGNWWLRLQSEAFPASMTSW